MTDQVPDVTERPAAPASRGDAPALDPQHRVDAHAPAARSLRTPVAAPDRRPFGIVREGPHVVCLHTPATRAAHGHQIARSRAGRCQQNDEGRCLAQIA